MDFLPFCVFVSPHGELVVILRGGIARAPGGTGTSCWVRSLGSQPVLLSASPGQPYIQTHRSKRPCPQPSQENTSHRSTSRPGAETTEKQTPGLLPAPLGKHLLSTQFHVINIHTTLNGTDMDSVFDFTFKFYFPY